MNVSVWRWETGTKTRRPVLQSPPTTTLHFSKKKLAFKSHFEVVWTVLEGRRWTFATDEPSLLSQLSRLHGVSQSQKNTRPKSLLPSLKHSEFCAEAVYQRIWNDFLHFSCNTDVLLLCLVYSKLLSAFWLHRNKNENNPPYNNCYFFFLFNCFDFAKMEKNDILQASRFFFFNRGYFISY